MKKLLIILLAGLCLLVSFVGCSSKANSPEAVAESYLKATSEGDAKTVVNLLPDKVLKEIMEDEGFDSKKELIEEMEDTLSAILDMNKEYKIKYSFKVLGSKDLSKDDLKDLKEDYKDDYNIRIETAKVVTIEITTKATYDGEKNESTTETDVPVIKIGNNWYFDYESANGFM